MKDESNPNLTYEIIDINPENINKFGLFCQKSKKKEIGYQSKLEWFYEQYKLGLKYKLLRILDKKGKFFSKGFIEYIPSEVSWRGIIAKNYLVIHCIWIIGSARKFGFGRLLVENCIDDAKKGKKDGVLVLTSDQPFSTSSSFFKKLNFSMIDSTPNFQLMCFPISSKKIPNPPLINRNKVSSTGIIIYDSHQCPYTKAMINQVKKFGYKMKIPVQTILLKTSEEVKTNPIPYGTFGIILDGINLPSYSMDELKFQQKIKNIFGP